MKLDLADVLVLGGMVICDIGTYYLNHWAALVLGGAFMIAIGLGIGRVSARRQAGKGE